MLILILFAFLAGVATIFAPCILPILPIVLSAGITGGKQRPLGIVVGLVASFTFFTLSLSYLTRYLGLDANILRNIAIIVLLLFGVLLLMPKLLEKFESWLSSILPQAKTNSKRTDFIGGLIVGVSLGLVWTPCVGPIIASVITLAATSSVNAASILITLSYAIGTSLPLLLIIYGGQSLLTRIKSLNKITGKLQIGFGIIMICTSLMMLFGLDLALQANLLSKLPSSISTGLTQQLEESNLVQTELQQLRGNEEMMNPMPSTGTTSTLPNLGKAPEITGITNWLNSDPLTLANLKGKVVLIDFWTYSCINCIRTLPYVTKWYDTYKDSGLVIIGAHAPEFAFEKNTANVQKAIEQFGIHYPVAQDNNFATWSAYNNRYWPAHYLIDAQGNLREYHFGEGNYAETEKAIRTLLLENQPNIILPNSTTAVDNETRNQQSPETYLGTARRDRLQSNATGNLPVHNWNLSGKWKSGAEYIESTTAEDNLSFHFVGKDVYLVINPASYSTPSIVTVTLDGHPIGSFGGEDVKDNQVQVNIDKLYHLAHFEQSEDHVLNLTFQTPGTKAFAFTFG